MRYTILFGLLFLFAGSASAQKILKLYKGGDKAIEYHIGQEIEFKLKGQDFFYNFQIKDLDFEQQRIIIASGHVPIKDIIAVKSYQHYQGANLLQKGLYTFGSAWLFFSLIDIVAVDGQKSNDQVIKEAVIVGSLSFLTGFLVKKLLAAKVYKLTLPNYSLGIVDLEVSKITP